MIENKNTLLTIFTPAYNRGYTLERLYKSLLKQTCMDFEWLIVNDGSTDNTEELIKKWISEKKINIKYYYQKNSGKSMAHNKGVKEAHSDFFMCVDSDDYLTFNAVETVKNISKKEKFSKCIGFVGFRGTKNGKPITKLNNNSIAEINTLNGFYSKGMQGDTVLVYRTNIIKKYKFPQFKGERFVPESYLYDLLDREGQMLLVKKVLYICEYLPDGYTFNMRNVIKKNPQGYMAYILQRISFNSSIFEKYKNTVRYIAVASCYYKKASDIIKYSNNKKLTAFCYLPGRYFYKMFYKNI